MGEWIKPRPWYLIEIKFRSNDSFRELKTLSQVIEKFDLQDFKDIVGEGDISVSEDSLPIPAAGKNEPDIGQLRAHMARDFKETFLSLTILKGPAFYDGYDELDKTIEAIQDIVRDM